MGSIMAGRALKAGGLHFGFTHRKHRETETDRTRNGARLEILKALPK